MRIEESSGISSGKYSHAQLNLSLAGLCEPTENRNQILMPLFFAAGWRASCLN